MPSGAFARVYRVGERRRVGPILVRTSASDGGPPRVGVVAGRKVGHAVQRNRAKRRMREAVRRTEPSPGTDYIITALDDLTDLSFEELCAAVGSAITGRPMKSTSTQGESR